MTDLFENHPDRMAAMREIEARPLERIPVPCRVRRLAAMSPSRQTGASTGFHAALSAWCIERGSAPPDSDGRHHCVDVGERRVIWELHTEFVTVTWICPPRDAESYPSDIGLELLSEWQLVAATRVDVIEDDSIPQNIQGGFKPLSLCWSSIDQLAQVATDFGLDEAGYTRFEVAGKALPALRLATTVRGLLEIETYRTMALLALPVVRRLNSELSNLEGRLAEAVDRMGDPALHPRYALAELNALSAAASRMWERTRFRFAATRAYGDILFERLEGLGEQPMASAMTIRRYLLTRIGPGIATCSATESRQGALASKLERATELLSVRLGLELQEQTGAVVASLAQTAANQLRLQQTVEGLSTIVITYYLVGLIGYILGAAAHHLPVDKTTILAVLVPVMAVAVHTLGSRIRRRIAPQLNPQGGKAK